MMDNPGQNRNKFATGFSSFDSITGGGLPRSSAIALIGKAGSEKTLLARQIVWYSLQKGARVLYYTVDQGAEEFRFDMLSRDWDVKPYEDNGMLKIVDVFSSGSDKMVVELNKLADTLERNEKTTDIDGNIDELDLDNANKISESFNKMSNVDYHKRIYDLNLVYKEGIRFISPFSIKSFKHRIAVFDSLSPLFSTNTEGVFQLLHVLKFATRAGKATGIGIMHAGVHGTETEEKFKSIADAIVEVDSREGSSSFIKIKKYAGKYGTGPFPLEQNEQGIKIIPLVMPELF